MELITWNVKGIDAFKKKRQIKHTLSAFQAKAVMLQEIELGHEEGINFSTSLDIRQIECMTPKEQSWGL